MSRQRDIYWYEDPARCGMFFIIGERGGPEYRVALSELIRQHKDYLIKTPEAMLAWAKEESQVVEFEEIKPEVKLLGNG